MSAHSTLPMFPGAGGPYSHGVHHDSYNALVCQAAVMLFCTLNAQLQHVVVL